MSLALRSNNVSLVGKHGSKIAIAERCNINGILATDVTKLGRCFDIVVEASGSESGFAAAIDLVRPRGKIVLKSTFHGRATWEAARVVVDEITIVGSRCGRMSPALELMKTGSVKVTALIDEELPLSQGLAAMDRAAEKGVLKILLSMGG